MTLRCLLMILLLFPPPVKTVQDSGWHLLHPRYWKTARRCSFHSFAEWAKQSWTYFRFSDLYSVFRQRKCVLNSKICLYPKDMGITGHMRDCLDRWLMSHTDDWVLVLPCYYWRNIQFRVPLHEVGLLLAEQLTTWLSGLDSSSHLCVLHEEISITLVRGVPRGSTQSIYKQLKRGEGKK